MRCPDCNKFVGFEEGDVEVQLLEIDEDGGVRAEVRIANNCSECSQELTEAMFELEADHSLECEKHKGEEHELAVEENGAERTSRSGHQDKKKGWVSHGGRYSKTFYGVEVSYKISCSCGKLEADGSFGDDVQASSMEPLV